MTSPEVSIGLRLADSEVQRWLDDGAQVRNAHDELCMEWAIERGRWDPPADDMRMGEA